MANAEPEDFELTNEVKEMLDERLKTDESLFVPAREAINKIAEKNLNNTLYSTENTGKLNF